MIRSYSIRIGVLPSILGLLSNIIIPTLPIHCQWDAINYQIQYIWWMAPFIEDETYNEESQSECILFINGILTNREIIEQNKRLLKKYLINRFIVFLIIQIH